MAKKRLPSQSKPDSPGLPLSFFACPNPNCADFNRFAAGHLAVAAVFIAQAYGIHLDFGQQLVVMLTATLASVGAAAIPTAGMVTMTIVLRAVDLPLEAVAIIATVDRILDMLRTAVNVWGDTCGVAIVSRLFTLGNETADAAAPP